MRDKRVKLTPEQRATIAQRRHQGESIRALAREYNISPTHVMRLAREAQDARRKDHHLSTG
jgi:transposase-like protein